MPQPRAPKRRPGRPIGSLTTGNGTMRRWCARLPDVSHARLRALARRLDRPQWEIVAEALELMDRTAAAAR